MSEPITAPCAVLVDLTDDDGLEIVVNVTTEGIIVDFFDAGRNDPEFPDPYKTVAMTWEDM
jgi:hypothetical protein